MNGKFDKECGTFPRSGFDRNLAVMRLDNLLTDKKSQPSATFIRLAGNTVEPLE
jgi:hypothetical protein